MRRLSVLLCLVACTIRNPAFDEPTVATGGAGNDSSSTTAVPTTSSSTTTGGLSLAGSSSDTVDPTTSPVTATTTTDPTTTTGPLLCHACEPCHTCVDGQCVPDAGAACDAPVDTPCEERVWGVTLDGFLAGCHRYAPVVGGTCDAAGSCLRTCTEMGDNLFTCDTRCVRDDTQCIEGISVQGLEVGALCVLATDHPKCPGQCVINNTFQNFTCTAHGLCEPTLNYQGCGFMKCTEDGCPAQCDDDQDCVGGTQCKGDTCQF